MLQPFQPHDHAAWGFPSAASVTATERMTLKVRVASSAMVAVAAMAASNSRPRMVFALRWLGTERSLVRRSAKVLRMDMALTFRCAGCALEKRGRYAHAHTPRPEDPTGPGPPKTPDDTHTLKITVRGETKKPPKVAVPCKFLTPFYLRPFTRSQVF